ncbi:hypothetical protein TNCV_797441 [Trichonephila clavipes]|nr:hypothetical protein TNCV_797441 [Trichonephila clavipes]
MSFSCISRSSVPTSSCLANGKRLGCCLIGGWSAVSILCCVTVVWPISLLFLENTSSNSWNSLSAELSVRGTIQHFLEGRESTVEASWIEQARTFADTRYWTAGCQHFTFLEHSRFFSYVANSYRDSFSGKVH